MSRPFLTARWQNLVMLNYEIDPAMLEPYRPRGTELDTFRGKHFISIVAFQFFSTRIRGVPIPCHRNFEEVNLRFYVQRTEGNEVRRGVVFICDVVKLRAVAAIARRVYNENYIVRPTSHTIQMNIGEQKGRIEYHWGRANAGAEFVGESQVLVPGSEEEFITEHYWGYTRQRDGSTIEYRVEHPRWRVWQPHKSWLTGEVASMYGDEFAHVLQKPANSAFVADGSPVQVFRGQQLVD